MIIWFLFFSLLMWFITLIDLRILNHPCVPGRNPTSQWYIILLMSDWIQLLIFCWGSCIYVHQWCWPEIFFFCGVFGFIEWIQKHSFLCSFLEYFETDRYYLLFKCLVKFTCEAVCSWTLVCWGCFLITVSISLLVIGLFIFSVSSWFSLGRL